MTLVDRTLVGFAWNHLRRSKKFWAAIAVSFVPMLAGIILLISDLITRANYPDYTFHPQFTEWVAYFALDGVIPLLALILAGGLLADEAQDRTFTYLLVRPYSRRTLYISKFLPIAGLLGVLAAGQVLIFALLRLISLGLTDPGARVQVVDSTQTIGAAALIWAMLPACMLAAVLVGWAYAAIFAFVSLIVQRFHFMVNLLYFAVWEVPWGNLGAGIGYLTVLFYGHSLVLSADPTVNDWGANWVPAWVAAPALIAAIAFWVWLGTYRIERQDFHVTSAAT